MLAMAVACVVALKPAQVSYVGDGLDQSWAAVLSESGRHGLAIGRDVIFTGGPLSALYTDYFVPGQFWTLFAMKLVLVACVVRAAATWPAGRTLLLAAAVAETWLLRDALFMAIPLLAALSTMTGDRSRVGWSTAALAVVAGAVVGLAKFSSVPMAILAFLGMDAWLVRRRHPPVLTVAFLFLNYIGFAMFAAEGSRFDRYILDSIDVAAGYTDAMSTFGNPRELALYVLVAVTALIVIARSEWRIARATGSREVPGLRAFLIAAFVFVTWKAGFVRHDGHTLVAWTGIAIALAVWGMTAPDFADVRAVSAMAAAIALFVVPFLASKYWAMSPLGFLDAVASSNARELGALVNLLKTPSAAVEGFERERAAAFARLRTNAPMPEIVGTVDVVPSIQSRAIAAYGDRYRPRYSIQEYPAYTHRLIEANRHSLTGVQNILFQPGSIDGRHPASADGALWTDLIRDFQPVRMSGALLHLARRATPLDDVVVPGQDFEAMIGSRIAIPAANVVLRADIKKTWLGRLGSLLFKPPVLFMRTRDADGTERVFRVIPAMLAEGMVIAPLVTNSVEFAALALGRHLDSRPVSVEFYTTPWAEFMYRRTFRASLAELRIPVAPRDETSEIDGMIAGRETGFASTPSRDNVLQIRPERAAEPRHDDPDVGPGAR